MFSGIIEAKSPVTKVLEKGRGVRIQVARPAHFDDIEVGHSICLNGVCLTLEYFDQSSLRFALGAETLGITGWGSEDLLDIEVNLERSLKWGGRIHGHIVTGHVDEVAEVAEVLRQGESVIISIKVSQGGASYLWKKGSICINGVSLTVNSCEGGLVSCCLIPQTLKETNLSLLQVGKKVNVEFDYLARGLSAIYEKHEKAFIENKNAHGPYQAKNQSKSQVKPCDSKQHGATEISQ